MTSRTYFADPIDDLASQIAVIRKQLTDVTNRKQIVVPIWDAATIPTTFPAGVEGQLVVGNNDVPYVHKSGTWTPVGSGAVVWEDVGSGATTQSVPYAAFTSSVLTTTGGGTWPQWTAESSNMPGGTFASVVGGATHTLTITQTGFYQVHFYLKCTSAITGTPDMFWQINGSAIGNVLVNPIINSGYVAQGGGNYYPYADMTSDWHVTTTQTFGFMALLGTGASLPSPTAEAVIIKLV